MIVELPDTARRKLLVVQQQLDDADALARNGFGTIRELEAMQHRLNASIEVASSEADKAADQRQLNDLEFELTRQRAEFPVRQQRATNTRQLLAQLRHFLEQHGGTALSPVHTPTPALQDGETLTDALTRLRADIKVQQKDLKRVRLAPKLREELREELQDRVAEMAERGQPTVEILGDKLTISLKINSRAPETIMEFLAWFDADALSSRLEDALPPDQAGAVASSERASRIAELERQLLANERQEESLIEQALASGQEVTRRTNASPLAVLGVAIGRAKSAKAA